MAVHLYHFLFDALGFRTRIFSFCGDAGGERSMIVNVMGSDDDAEEEDGGGDGG